MAPPATSPAKKAPLESRSALRGRCEKLLKPVVSRIDNSAPKMAPPATGPVKKLPLESHSTLQPKWHKMAGKMCTSSSIHAQNAGALRPAAKVEQIDRQYVCILTMAADGAIEA